LWKASRLRGAPGYQLSADLLEQPAFHGQRLAMRQRFLQREALLKHVAIPDAVKEFSRQLPAGPGAIARQVDQGGLALVVMMDDGRIIEEGTPEHFFVAPREERTKQFLSKIL